MKRKKPKNDDSSNIKELTNNFKNKAIIQAELAEARSLIAQQELNIQKLFNEIEKRNEEIQHLKNMLQKSVPIIGNNIQKIDEETIASMQLDKLKSIAEKRELTLEEARKYEIFSKVKRMAQETKPILPQFPHLPKNISNNELLKIAEKSVITKDLDDE